MAQTQSFRLIGTNQILSIPIQCIDGQNVISWESIEQVFPGVKCVKNADVAVPRCIQYFPGVVLDVVLSTTSESIPVDSSVEAPSMLPTATLNSALTVDQTDAPADPPVDPSSEDKSIENLQVTSALANMPIGGIGIRRPSTSPSSLPPNSSSKVETASKTALSFIEAVKRASEKAKDPDGPLHRKEFNAMMHRLFQLQEAKQEEVVKLQRESEAKQDEMIKLQRESDAKQKEMIKLQRESDARQEEIIRLQDEMKQLALDHHEETKQMQQRALDQLSLLHSRVQAVLTQTYELHEYPIPRLFIVLPQYPSGWDILEPFTEKYRLYFLCECGEHTKAAGSNNKIPHEIHLAKHEGYEIARPTDFFQQYGPYILTILKVLKLSVSVANVAVPAVAHLVNADALDHTAKGLQHLKDCIEPGMDQVITKIEKDSMDEGQPVENFADQMVNKEAPEGADLRKLETFLKDKDGNRVLGNLYRTVTDQGHVKWVCVDHYRENYNKTAAEQFRRAVDSVGGSFDENSGVVEVELTSKVQAEQFYAALEKARSVHELKIELSWETTYGDFKRLRDTLRITNVGVLEFGYSGTGPASDYVNRNRRYDPIRQIMGHPSIQSFTMASITDDFLKRSNLNAADIDFSNLKRLVIGGFDSDAFIDKFKLVLSHAPNISSLSLVTPKRLFEGFSPWSKRASIFSDLRYMGIFPWGQSDTISIELDMEMKPSNVSSLLLKAPYDFLKKCNLWPADADFSNLRRLVIQQFDLDTATVTFYMVQASALTTLELPGNSIGAKGANALAAELLKNNSTLASLDLMGNSIGDDGAQALAAALKINTSLTTLDLTGNSIGDDGAQAFAELLKMNSFLASLDLTGNLIGDDGAQALAAALKTNKTLTTLGLKRNLIWFKGLLAFSEAIETNSMLTTFDIHDNKIGDGGAKVLSEALKTNSRVTSLNLDGNLIGDDGVKSLAEALKTNSTLTTLNLKSNSIGDNGARVLAEALKTNSMLTTLDMQENSIEGSGAKALSEALKTNSRLTTLSLEFNWIGVDGAKALAEALKTNSTLTTLNLRGNSIIHYGAEALSETLRINSSLTTLYLPDNSIGSDGAEALAEALKANSTLTTLGLNSNSIRDDGAKALAEALKTNSTLTTLDLKSNSIGDNGAKALAEALKTNSRLTTLSLEFNWTGVDGAKALAEALKTNSTLTTLGLNSNTIGDDGAKALAEVLKTNSALTVSVI